MWIYLPTVILYKSLNKHYFQNKSLGSAWSTSLKCQPWRWDSLAGSSSTALSQGTKCSFWVFFPREHRTEVKVLEGYSRAQTYCNFCRHWVPLLLWGQVRWIHLPGDFQMELMVLERNSSFLVAIKRRNQESAAPPLILLPMPSSTVNLHPVLQIPMFLQVPMNHVLPASQKASWIPEPQLPPMHMKSFIEAQHFRGKYIPFNEYIPLSNWLSLTWKIESSAEDSFPGRDFFSFF